MKTKILLLITALMLSVSSADAQSLLKKIGKGVEAVAKEATKAAKSATKEGKQSSKSTSSSKTSSQKQSSKKKAKRVYIANENTCRDPKFIDQTGQIVQLDIDGMLYRLNLKDGYAWVDCTMEYKRGNLRGEAKIWATILYEGNVYPVTRVKNGAYSAEGITSLKLSYDMEEIEAGAFKETRLREVYIPSSVKKVGPASFCEIKTLKTAFLEEGVEDLGGTVFAGCTALEEVRLPSTIKKMDIYVFDGCTSLKNVTFLCKVKKIPNFTFRGAKAMTQIQLPETIEEIGNSAFEDTGLKSFTFHPNIKKIGDSACAATALTEVTIPSTIEEIGTYAFVDCKNLKKINISKKWKDITLIVEIFGNDPHIITSHNLDECKIFNWID